MNDRLRDALQVLAERSPQSDPDEFAARVLHAAAPPRRRWVRLAIAAAAAAVIVAVVVATPDDKDAAPPPVSTPTTPTLPTRLEAMAPPTTQNVTPTTTSQQAMPGWRQVDLGSDTGYRLMAGATSGDRVVVLASSEQGAGAFVPAGRDLAVPWTYVPNHDAAGDRMEAAVGTEEGFVAVGRHTTADEWRPVVWRSPDGRRWTRTVLDAPVSEDMTDVARRGNRLVAVGTRRSATGGFLPAGWYSDDQGRSWQHAPFDDSRLSALFAVTATPDGFVAAGSDIWTSPDGAAWTRAAAPIEKGEPVMDLAYGGGQLVAVGLDALVMTSADGRRWSKAPKASENGVQLDAAAVLHVSDGSWLMGSASGGLWQSLDGRNWILASDPVAAQVVDFAALPDGTVLAIGSANSTSGRSSRSVPAIWIRE